MNVHKKALIASLFVVLKAEQAALGYRKELALFLTAYMQLSKEPTVKILI